MLLERAYGAPRTPTPRTPTPRRPVPGSLTPVHRPSQRPHAIPRKLREPRLDTSSGSAELEFMIEDPSKQIVISRFE